MADKSRDKKAEKDAKKELKKQEIEERKAKRKEDTKNLKLGYQYFVGFIVALGGFQMGTCIGWSSPAQEPLQNAGIPHADFKWVASVFALGSAFAQIFAAFMIKVIGLKYAIILFEFLTTCAWVVLTISTNFWIIIAGRVMCGFVAGVCVSCPVYLGEVTHKSHRGTLGVCFQLFVTGGNLYAFCLGTARNLYILNIGSGMWCVVAMILTILFVPHSPYALMRKGKEEKAIKILEKTRGKNYDIKKEIDEIKAAIGAKKTVGEGLTDRVNLKSFGVLLLIHILQQVTGVNAIMYHAHYIFERTSTYINKHTSVIIMGSAQIAIAIVCAYAVDRAGRRLLFSISLSVMGVAMAIMGFYFMMLRTNPDFANTIAVVPTLTLVMYKGGFSLGTGPLPWAMIGEYLPDSVKPIMAMIISFINWILAFTIAWLMPVLMTNVESELVFYGFAIMCLIGVFCVLLFLVETNQKTFEQIQSDIGAHRIGWIKKKSPPT